MGDILAKNIITFFDDPANRIVIRELKDLGVNMTYLGPKLVENENFSHKKFVLTGTLSFITREELKEIIESFNGTVSSSVSKKTDVVIVGDDPGSKYDKAISLGIEIWDEDKIKSLLNN